jgi:hypothetical protein
MDKRSRASLTYRIITEMLGLALVLGAFSLSTVSDYTASTLVRNLMLFAVVFAVLIATWWRLSSMFEIGILAGTTGVIAGMMMAFSIALAPVFIRLIIASNGGIRSLAATLLTVSFIVITGLLAVLVHRSHAYRTKAQWRIVHHALWLMSGIFLISLFVPLAFAPVAEFPARFVLWILALAAVPLYQKAAASFVTNPAQPLRAPAPVAVSGAPASSATEGPSSHHSSGQSNDDRPPQQQRDRYPRRQRGRFRRHSGPSRRRM